MIKDARVPKTGFSSIYHFERKIITSQNRLRFGPHFENRVVGPDVKLKAVFSINFFFDNLKILDQRGYVYESNDFTWM